MLSFALSVLLLGASATAKVVYDGRIPFSYTPAQLDASASPFITVVKGPKPAHYYNRLQGHKVTAPDLWKPVEDQSIGITIDKDSIFAPGGDASKRQYGFRRTELIAQNSKGFETGTAVFHFSFRKSDLPLNYEHEYQIAFIELDDGHLFTVKLGSDFTIPAKKDPNADKIKVVDHAGTVIFSTPMHDSWHNFGIQVDWDAKTLAVLYSRYHRNLEAVTKAVPNSSAPSGSAAQGEFHWGVLKLPLPDPKQSSAEQNDVAHHGIQEGTRERLIYAGVFVEDVQDGISIGHSATLPKIA